MSLVNVLNVIVKQSKTPFCSPIAFDIYFESVKSLKHSLTWRIIYIGQASNDQYDQILEEAEMDCEVAGRMTFTLEVSITFNLLMHSYRVNFQMIPNCHNLILSESLPFSWLAHIMELRNFSELDTTSTTLILMNSQNWLKIHQMYLIFKSWLDIFSSRSQE